MKNSLIKQFFSLVIIAFSLLSLPIYADVTNNDAPSITGNTYVGATLTGNIGQWTSSNGSTIHYDLTWYRCDGIHINCVAVTSVNTTTYIVNSADLNKVIRFEVIAYDSDNLPTIRDAFTLPITLAPEPPVNISLPQITSSSGLYNVGVTLVASNGGWINSPTTFSYNWMRCNALGANCSFITGATGVSYMTNSSDVNSTLKVQVVAVNAVGASAPATSPQTPVITSLYNFTGFLSPIDNPPVFNEMKAGSSAPFKFSLGGDKGLNIITSSVSTAVSCTGGIVDETPIVTESAGNSGLSYDPLTDQYTYVWKTEKSWKNSCRQVTIKLTDGSSHQALFRFK